MRNETVANLSMLPAEAVDTIEATLKGNWLVRWERRSRSPGRCRTGMWPRSLRWRAGWGCPRCWAGVPVAGHRCGTDRLAGAAAGVETVHPGLVGRHHAGRRSGRGRRVHRRDLRGDGLAGRPAGDDREEARGTAFERVGESGADGVVRSDLLVGNRPALRVGRARLLPRRQEGLREPFFFFFFFFFCYPPGPCRTCPTNTPKKLSSTRRWPTRSGAVKPPPP